MGLGAAFYLDLRRGPVWSTWQSNSNGLYRRPPESQGELRSSGDLDVNVGRTLRRNLDLKGIFQADFYRFERFEGPIQVTPAILPPPQVWQMSDLAGTSVFPAQQINSALLGLGGTFKPDTLLRLTSIVGQQWEKREGFDDQGLSASLRADLTDFEYRGYRNDLDLYLEQEELGDRLNRELRFNYGLDKGFSDNSSDRLEVHYRQKRHDYHIWGDSYIGTRMDTDQSIRNQLLYNAYSHLGFIFDTQLVGSTHEDRTPTANTIREEITTANVLTVQTKLERTTGWTRLRFDWGAQEDATGLKRERGTSLEGGFSWLPTREDSLALQTAVRKRQYDTSDTANYDDRDRLRYEFELRYERKLSADFRVSNRAQITLEHLVYIFGEKSDQNHWNRIFKLSPEVEFEPHPDWHNRARFELVANSTDYDFELDPTFIKSTIYRRYTAADSLAWTIQRGCAIAIEYAIDLEDGGRLLWDEWIQEISDQYRTQQASVLLIRQTRAGIRFESGLSVYERKGWQYTQSDVGMVKSPFLRVSRWGPVLQLSYPSAAGLSIEMTADLSWVHEWNAEDYTIVNLDLRVTWL